MHGGICDVRVCIVCLEHLLSFSTRVLVQSLITANQRRTLYFKSQPYLEDLGRSAVDGIRTHNILIDNLCLTTRTPPLIANLKALNFKQWHLYGFSNPLKIIPLTNISNHTCLYKILGLQRYPSAIDALKELRKS